MSQNAEAPSKHCPFCDEEIRFKAIKCRFCSEFLPDAVEARRAQHEVNRRASHIARRTPPSVNGSRVRELREQLGMTANDLAIQTEVGIGAVQRAESSTPGVHENVIARIASALGVEPSDICDGHAPFPARDEEARTLEWVSARMSHDVSVPQGASTARSAGWFAGMLYFPGGSDDATAEHPDLDLGL